MAEDTNTPIQPHTCRQNRTQRAKLRLQKIPLHQQHFVGNQSRTMVLQQFCSCSSVKTWETHKTNHLFLFLSKQLDWSHSLTLHHLSFFQWDGSFLWLINRTTRQIWNKTKYEWTGIQINTSVQSLECTARKTTTRSKQSTSGCLDAEAQQVAQSSHTWRVWFWTRLVIFQPWQLYLQCEIWTQFEKESSLVLRKNRNFLHTHRFMTRSETNTQLRCGWKPMSCSVCCRSVSLWFDLWGFSRTSEAASPCEVLSSTRSLSLSSIFQMNPGWIISTAGDRVPADWGCLTVRTAAVQDQGLGQAAGRERCLRGVF